MVRRWLGALLLTGAVGALAATSALAAAGGGNGAGAAPSASASQYDPSAEYAKGIAAMQAMQYWNAAEAFEHVTEAAPTNPDGWRVLGAAYAGQSNWKASRRAYERSLKLAPDDMTSHAGLGLALANMKDPKAQGEADWLKVRAQACGDGCPDAARLMALEGAVEGAMSGGGDGPKPGATLENHSLLFAGARAGDVAYVQAVRLINERRYDEALTSLAAAEAVFGPHPDVITYQGYTWRKKGDYDRAEGYYRQALAIAPAHRGATEYYGELKVERGDLRGANLLLAKLNRICAYGCAEADELRRWIDAGGDPHERP